MVYFRNTKDLRLADPLVKSLSLNMANLWARLMPYNPVKVSTDGCRDVDDFIVAVKKKLSPRFDSIADDLISLSMTDGGPS